MDWVRKNKFLASFIAAMVVGVAVMGYLLYVTESRYDQTSQEYNTQVTELKRLEALKPYPEEANLKRFNEQKSAYAVAVNTLQTNMAAMAPAADKNVSPTDFQNRLRDLVAEVSKSAVQVGVALPDGFYLGFEQYRGQLPDAAATQLLNEQLTQIEQIVRILINRKVEKINSVKRAPLPGETAVVALSSQGEKPKSTGVELVVQHPIELSYTAAPNAFRETLALIAQAPRIYVIRAIQVKNEVDKGPVRGQDPTVGPPGGVRPAPGGAPGNPAAPGDQALPEKGPPPLRYVVGQEKLDIVMNIELDHVQAPAK